MNENIKWVAAAVAVVGLAIGAVVYRDSWWRSEPPAPVAQPAKPVPPPPVEPAEAQPPAIAHPLPETPAKASLPALDASDEPMQLAITELMGLEAVKRFVHPQNFVRNVVTTIDNLPEQKVAERIRPLYRITGEFAATGSEEEPVLDPANYARYEPLVQSIKAVDTKQLVESYTKYYPLFQQSYEGLGHSPEYFNDRLIQVIDHLLETPEVRDPIPLARPNVQFEYKDPKLEALSAGQKLLIRMGGANAAVVKAKLRELRAAVEK